MNDNDVLSLWRERKEMGGRAKPLPCTSHTIVACFRWGKKTEHPERYNTIQSTKRNEKKPRIKPPIKHRRLSCVWATCQINKFGFIYSCGWMWNVWETQSLASTPANRKLSETHIYAHFYVRQSSSVLHVAVTASSSPPTALLWCHKIASKAALEEKK